MPIDAQMLQAAFNGSGHQQGPRGEVWYSFAGPVQQQQHQQAVVHYLSVVDLEVDWQLSLGAFRDTVQSRMSGGKFAADLSARYWVLERSSPGRVVGVLSQETPLTLRACGISDFQLYTVVPQVHEAEAESPNWSVVGELDKWVGASAARFQEIRAGAEAASAVFDCVGGETVSVSFISPIGEVATSTCSCDAAATGVHGDIKRMVATSEGLCSSK